MPRKAGRGDPIITEERVREYLQEHSPPLAGTTQIANQFEVARPSVIERLNTLEEEGVVGKRKVGQSFAWYLDEWRETEVVGSGPATESDGGSQAQQVHTVKVGVAVMLIASIGMSGLIGSSGALAVAYGALGIMLLMGVMLTLVGLNRMTLPSVDVDIEWGERA